MRDASSQLVLTTGVATRTFASITAINGADRGPNRAAPTLAEYSSLWLTSLRGLVRPRTFKDYRYRLERYVLPRLGDRRLDEIDVEDILTLIAELRSRGYAACSIRSCLSPLSRLLSHAVRRDLIAANPIRQLDRSERPSPWGPGHRVLNRDEIPRLLDAAAPRYRTLLATAILSGLRQGELLGLRWRDVDFAAGLIYVRTALDRDRQHALPKTRHGVRDVVLMPALARALEQHRQDSKFDAPGDYVFASQVGTPLHWGNVSRRALKPAIRTAGIEPLRWHDLRHTYASLLIAGGANITFVSRQLGHSSSEVTLRIYAHLFDCAEHAQRTRNMLQEMFGSVI